VLRQEFRSSGVQNVETLHTTFDVGVQESGGEEFIILSLSPSLPLSLSPSLPLSLSPSLPL
jgi:hypothetical protein